MSLEQRTILIDGYNVIRSTPALAAVERVSLREGREALLTWVATRYRHTPHTVIVVFDGSGSRETVQALARGVSGRVVFTCCGESADLVIGRIATDERARGAEVVVVSNDLEVRTGVGAVGGRVAPVADLQAHLTAPGKYQVRMARHRAYVRRQLAGQEGESPESRQSGNPRRLPRRRRGDAPKRFL